MELKNEEVQIIESQDELQMEDQSISENCNNEEIAEEQLIIEEEVIAEFSNADEMVADQTEGSEPISEDFIPTQDIVAFFETISKKFDDKIAVDIHKNQLFDKLYVELQSMKDDPYKKAMKPIFMDMIVFSDTMRRLVSKYKETPSEEELPILYQKLRKEFDKVGDHITDLLYNYNIEPFEAQQGSEFDSKTQQSKKTSLVEKDVENKKVIESLAPGYYWDGALLRKESIHIGLKENTNN